MPTCPICGATGPFEPKHSICQFTKTPIGRLSCPGCNVIFGPLDMISMSLEQMNEEYERLYSSYSEGDTTEYETSTFMSLPPIQGKTYLNFGAGRWSRTTKNLKAAGYDVTAYDPFVSSEWVSSDSSVLERKYDGIFSHNVIEHLQDPVGTFRQMASMLKPSGTMAHSTACYEYRYEYSKYHLFFYLGRSPEILSSITGFEICGGEKNNSGGGYIRKNFLLRKKP